VGPPRGCTWILGLTDYRVIEFERHDHGRLVIEIERRGMHRYVSSLCGWRTGRLRDARPARGTICRGRSPVTVRYQLRRLRCRFCGIRTERVGLADPHAR